MNAHVPKTAEDGCRLAPTLHPIYGDTCNSRFSELFLGPAFIRYSAIQQQTCTVR